MKRVMTLFLAASIAATAFGGFAATAVATQNIASNSPVIAVNGAIDEGMQVSPVTAVLMQTTKRAAVYDAVTDKIVGYAQKGFVINAQEDNNGHFNFDFATSDAKNPTVGYYIKGSYLTESTAAGDPVPATISGDVITLKNGATLYGQDGTRLYTTKIPSAPFHYVLKDKKGYNFTFGGNYVYVKTSQATVSSPSTSTTPSLPNASNPVINPNAGGNVDSGMTVRPEIDPGMTVQPDIDSGMTVTPEVDPGMTVKPGVDSGMTAPDQKENTLVGTITEVLGNNSFMLKITNNNNLDQAIIKYAGAELPEVKLEKGLLVEVFHNGVMTASLPAQITALKIILPQATIERSPEVGYQLSGSIVKVDTKAKTLLVKTPDMGNVLVKYTNAKMPKIALKTGNQINVKYNGIMTRSIPGQISADSIELVTAAKVATELKGSITSIDTKSNSFTMSNSTHGEVIVKYGEAKMPRIALKRGQKVTVVFSGAMTMSLPPQVGATQIIID